MRNQNSIQIILFCYQSECECVCVCDPYGEMTLGSRSRKDR
jgi:hypothetical protein